MSEELLPYYQRELAFIRTLGAQFAEAKPKIAGRLRMRAEGTQDPHVERMIEAFAYLNARVRHKLDDDFPELTHAMLDVLYPHYLAPVPSMSIAQFELDPAQAEQTSGYALPTGLQIETSPIQGQPCRFRTCYPVILWPIQVAGAELAGPPFQAPVTPFTSKTSSLLHLKLSCLSPAVRFADMSMGSLRFYIRAQTQHAFSLYELLFDATAEMAITGNGTGGRYALLDNTAIQPVGFGRDEGMIPYPSRSFLGYRLLTEYFAFPEKFLFFDLDLSHLTAFDREEWGQEIDLFFYLKRSVPEIEPHVTAETFQLGCAPIVNLFKQRAEPIRLTHTDSEYRVVPDARRPLATEVYSIDRVTATSPRNEQVEYRPFYSFRHSHSTSDDQVFFHAMRRPGSLVADVTDNGTEVFLSFVDLDFSTAAAADWTIDVETTCLNRDLPHNLPFGGGQPRLQLTQGGLATPRLLTPPTPTLRPTLRHGVLWRLISHLSLNHLSLTDAVDGADALREILKLYDFADSEETRSMIDGIESITTRRVVGRSLGEARGGMCRGTEATIHFDEDKFVGSGVYLFACVLDRFLSLYCSINSFTQLAVTTTKREGKLGKWRPRAGEQVLL